MRVDEVALKNPTSDALRSFPLARIEAAADAGGFMLGFAMTYNNPKPPDLDKHFQKIKRQASSNKSAGRFVLEWPEGRFLDNGFYIRVAKAYREAVALGLNPRQTLAKDSHSATDTVARWVGEARRRGYLPPGRPGKVTAHFEEGGPNASWTTRPRPQAAEREVGSFDTGIARVSTTQAASLVRRPRR